MKKLILFLLASICLLINAPGQVTRYLVKLKDKGGSPYNFDNPNAYLSLRALERRAQYSIALDSTDLPVTPAYLNQLGNVPNVIILNVSKWLNAVSILTSDAAAITSIGALPFVQSVQGLAQRPEANGRPSSKFDAELTSPKPSRVNGIQDNYFDYGSNSFDEVHLHNAEFLHNVGLRGQGMQIAMLDDGFYNYQAFHAFDSVNINNQVLGTWDFVAGESNVINDGSHGMSCFSTIAANLPGQFIGNAPKAGFWLFRTEDDATEYPIEELNWACGAEHADSSGADVISTSLGYTTFDLPLDAMSHSYADMNGNTTMAAIAADLCAKKGILVFASIGNDGVNTWHFLSTPADGDSVVAVGAVDVNGSIASFSSFGPSSDGRVKPDVLSVGASALIENSAGFISNSNGTSFACPKMAGMGTCLWQGFPEFNNARIIRALHEAGNLFASPGSQTGYGIPDMKKAFSSLLADYASSSAAVDNCSVNIQWQSKDVASMKYQLERKTAGQFAYAFIGTINSSGTDFLGIHTYTYTDTLINVSDGPVSYRIRQIIDTTTAGFADVYIDTASVTSSGCISNTGTITEFIQLSPNPASTQSTLIVETSAAIPQLAISIYDMKGSLVLRLLQSKGIGRTGFELPVNKLAKGKYVIKVNDGKRVIGTASLLRL